MTTKIIKILIIIFVLAGLFAIMQFNFLKANIDYWVHPPVTQKQNANPKAVLPRGEEVQATSTPDTVAVPSLGIKAPIVYIVGANEQEFQQGLLSGVVHYPTTAMPGQLGNCYIFGHSSDFIWSKGKFKTVFALLPKIKIGAEIRITDSDGRLFIYHVTSTKIVNPDDTTVLDQGGNKARILTLQTSYPVGTALQRFVAISEME